jgi:hypothetical protein
MPKSLYQALFHGHLQTELETYIYEIAEISPKLHSEGNITISAVITL